MERRADGGKPQRDRAGKQPHDLGPGRVVVAERGTACRARDREMAGAMGRREGEEVAAEFVGPEFGWRDFGRRYEGEFSSCSCFIFTLPSSTFLSPNLWKICWLTLYAAQDFISLYCKYKRAQKFRSRTVMNYDEVMRLAQHASRSRAKARAAAVAAATVNGRNNAAR